VSVAPTASRGEGAFGASLTIFFKGLVRAQYGTFAASSR
jgi:hypothetical protein